MPYQPDPQRYQHRDYRRVGRSGLMLPPISLGLWHNFGNDVPFDSARSILRRAFDLGITHFDLANNYGHPAGSAEETAGRVLTTDFKAHRDELVISTKAGYRMQPGPYGDGGSRKHLLGSLDQSLRRMQIDYVDIFYSHRFDPQTPLEETMGALHTAVSSGRALYAGISSYSAEQTRQAAEILAQMGTPLLLHQPSYSMANRWIEAELLDAIGELGVGCIAFSPLARGLLTDKFLDGRTPAHTSQRPPIDESLLTDDVLAALRELNSIAEERSQSLAQMSLAWALRDDRMSSLLVGASSVHQLEDNVAALAHAQFSSDELATIDALAARLAA